MQKAINDLYHKEGIDIKLVNVIVSYIEMQDYKLKETVSTNAKLIKKIAYEMMPIAFIERQIELTDSDDLRRLLGEYMDGKGEEH